MDKDHASLGDTVIVVDDESQIGHRLVTTICRCLKLGRRCVVMIGSIHAEMILVLQSIQPLLILVTCPCDDQDGLCRVCDTRTSSSLWNLGIGSRNIANLCPREGVITCLCRRTVDVEKDKYSSKKEKNVDNSFSGSSSHDGDVFGVTFTSARAEKPSPRKNQDVRAFSDFKPKLSRHSLAISAS